MGTCTLSAPVNADQIHDALIGGYSLGIDDDGPILVECVRMSDAQLAETLAAVKYDPEYQQRGPDPKQLAEVNAATEAAYELALARERRDLAGARLAEAEDGQAWVDAVAAGEQGKVGDLRSAVLAAIDAVNQSAADAVDLEERDQLQKALTVATLDLAAQTADSRNAQRAADAHRAITVDAAKTDLVAADAALAALA